MISIATTTKSGILKETDQQFILETENTLKQCWTDIMK